MSEEPAVYEGQELLPESKYLHLAEAPWAKVPLALAREDFSGADLRTYIAIDGLAGRRGYWYGLQSELVEMTGVSERQVSQAVRRLRDGGYLLTEALGLRYNNMLLYVVPARTRGGEVAAPVPAEKRGAGARKTAETDRGNPPLLPITTDQDHRSQPQMGADAPARGEKPKKRKLDDKGIAELRSEFGFAEANDAIIFWQNDYRLNFKTDQVAFIRSKILERRQGNGRAQARSGNGGHRPGDATLDKLRETGRLISG